MSAINCQQEDAVVEMFTQTVSDSLEKSDSIVNASYMTMRKLTDLGDWAMPLNDLHCCVLWLTVMQFAKAKYKTEVAQQSFVEGFCFFVGLNGEDFEPNPLMNKAAWRAGRKANPKYQHHLKAKSHANATTARRYGKEQLNSPEALMFWRTKYWTARGAADKAVCRTEAV